MTAKQKAKELVNKFKKYTDGSINKYTWSESFQKKNAKSCALIAVDEILNENSKRGGENDEIIEYEPYWNEVKQEIEKL